MKFKKALLKLAKQSSHHKSQHAAIVAQGKRLLGSGFNVEGHHAEEQALWRAFGKTKGTTMYTLMVRRKSGSLGNGSPCPACMKSLTRAGVKRVVVYV